MTRVLQQYLGSVTCWAELIANIRVATFDQVVQIAG